MGAKVFKRTFKRTISLKNLPTYGVLASPCDTITYFCSSIGHTAIEQSPKAHQVPTFPIKYRRETLSVCDCVLVGCYLRAFFALLSTARKSVSVVIKHTYQSWII